MNELKTTRWREKSKKILKRDKYIDQFLLKKYGLIKEATLVHHILPRDKYPQYTFCDWNLISVSWETHVKKLHNNVNGELTKEGKQLMKETAFINGIKLEKTILVIGLPESGKTSYVKKNIGDGLAYDLDYIAAAFRLKSPKEEMHVSSRKMANRLLKGFIVEAPKYNSNVFIIRTAPYENEVYEINPDKIVVCEGGFNKKLSNKYDIDIDEAKNRINETIKYAELNHVEIEYYRKEI